MFGYGKQILGFFFISQYQIQYSEDEYTTTAQNKSKRSAIGPSMQGLNECRKILDLNSIMGIQV